MEKKLEYYTLKPNLKQFYGIKVHKNTVFDEETENGVVKQHLENLTLTTTIYKKTEKDDKNPYEIEEESKMTVKMPSGTILIWDENEGFIISPYPMTTLTDLKKEIDEMKEIYKESKV
jgi:hypothetical protein